jgi:glycosyltransferase involved in cell wall biosynthesis
MRQSGMNYVLIFDSCEDRTLFEFKDILENSEAYHVKILFGEYGSPGLARNAGLEKVASNWVVFWDADDFPHPEALCETIENVDQSKVDLVVTQYDTIKFGSSKSSSLVSQTNTKLKLAINPGIWRIIFNVNHVKGFLFKQFRMGEDQLFIAQFMTSKPRILFSNVKTYSYSLEVPGQLTGNRDAIKDLRLTFLSIIILIVKSNVNKIFLSLMALRQLLTIFKKTLQD